MRKLKLQVQLSIDGFNAGPNGEMDSMTWNWDDKLKNFVSDLHSNIDTILLGRKMTDGFVGHWESVKPEDPSYPFARIMVDTPKVVFSKTLDKSTWNNTKLAKGNLSDEVNNLKSQKGKDIIVYGGSGFVSSLIAEDLIDDYFLFVNPAVLGNGSAIFKSITSAHKLKLKEAIGFDCGIVLLHYEK
ncbi:MAG: dihydrofolate reductase family protein [Cyclobacteriaceae bacterium]